MLRMTSRPTAQAMEIFRKRAAARNNPFLASIDEPEVIHRDIAPMSPEWVDGFVSGARDFAARAEAAESAGEPDEARDLWLQAYDYCHIARYPAMNTDQKRDAHRLGLQYFERYLEHRAAVRREVLSSRFGEVPVLWMDPADQPNGGVILAVGGLDVWKEDMVAVHLEKYVNAGFTLLVFDMPGTGESPIAASTDVDALWSDVLDQLPERGLDARNISMIGMSFGGYWAARAAHTHHDRLRSSVTHGGPAHWSFTEEWFNGWVERGEYPTGFSDGFLEVMRCADTTELERRFGELSLETTGLLDGPSCELLCVNGVDDKTIDPREVQLLIQRGRPKSVRLFPGGHMGMTPSTIPTIVEWLMSRSS